MKNNKKTMLISGLIGFGTGLFVSGVILSILVYKTNAAEPLNHSNMEQIKEDDLEPLIETVDLEDQTQNHDLEPLIETDGLENKTQNNTSETQAKSTGQVPKKSEPEMTSKKPETITTKPQATEVKIEPETIEIKAEPETEQAKLEPETEEAKIEPQTIEVKIARKASARKIADLLEEKGVVLDSSDFLAYIISENASRQLQQGTKTFILGSDNETVLKILTTFE